jgi:hypothetical protein
VASRLLEPRELDTAYPPPPRKLRREVDVATAERSIIELLAAAAAAVSGVAMAAAVAAAAAVQAEAAGAELSNIKLPRRHRHRTFPQKTRISSARRGAAKRWRSASR